MTNERFASVLADCLQAIDEGRATREDCVARYPEFALLEEHLSLLARLGEAAPAVPVAAQNVAAQRLQQAVIARNSAASQSTPNSFLRALPKGIAVALGALLLAGGAAGASAAVGGPNIAGEVLSVVKQLPHQIITAVGRETPRGETRPEPPAQRSGENSASGEAAAATVTPSATPSSNPPDGSPAEHREATPEPAGTPALPPATAERGLCQAYLAGGGREAVGPGQPGNRLDAAAFQRLSEAAGEVAVDVYCRKLVEQDRSPAPRSTPDATAPGPPKGGGNDNQGNQGVGSSAGGGASGLVTASPTPAVPSAPPKGANANDAGAANPSQRPGQKP